MKIDWTGWRCLASRREDWLRDYSTLQITEITEEVVEEGKGLLSVVLKCKRWNNGKLEGRFQLIVRNKIFLIIGTIQCEMDWTSKQDVLLVIEECNFKVGSRKENIYIVDTEIKENSLVVAANPDF